MDIIQQCLSLAPVPYLAPAFSVLRVIWTSVRQAQASKRQLQALAQTIAQLLLTLNNEYTAGRLLQTNTLTPFADLRRLLDEISEFVQQEASRGFLKLLFTKDERIARIDDYYRRISTAVTSFQLSTFLNIYHFQRRNDVARAADQQELKERLMHLEANQQLLVETLNTHQSNMMAMIVSLRKRLRTVSDEVSERQFFAHTLRYLTTSSGRQVELEDWMITSYDVEFGNQIGSGGFAKVFKGLWNQTTVALKVFVTEDGVTPSSIAIRHEIKMWSKIRHPNVLQFLGANVLDDKPFIVMPYLKNGNARDYLHEHQDSDRLSILRDISLALVHLHSLHIVHGDLKALNILIDDSCKAVLCDFGLSRVKADITSRTARLDKEGIIGSRNWMAPEQLRGGSLKKPCDVYAFGMTLYEIVVNETPLSHLDSAEFIELVVHQDVRPERPGDEDAPQISDALWELAEKCWMKHAKDRPTASAVCHILSDLLDNAAFARRTPGSYAPHVISQPIPPRPLSPSPNLIMQGHSDRVLCAAFSPDNKYIVSGSDDCTIRVWDARTGKHAMGPLKMHTHSVLSIAFSPSGRHIASGSRDHTILVWDMVTGQPVAGPFKGHTSRIWSVCFSPEGKRLASGSRDTTIRVWDAQTGINVVSPLSGHTDGVGAVIFSGDGKQLASASDDWTVRVWDARSGRLIQGPLRGHHRAVWSAAFSSDGKRIVSVSRGGDVCVWNVATGALLSGPSQQHRECVLAITATPISTYHAVSPDGKWIAGYMDNNPDQIQVWDSKTGLLAATVTAHTDKIRTVAFSPDSKRVLSASYDKTIRVHNLVS